MSIKEIVKKNRLIRSLGKKYNIYSAYIEDAHAFSGQYIESAENKDDYRYSILLIVHSIEKGMCMHNLRPFGSEKVKQLVEILQKYDKNRRQEFEYLVGLSILFSWKQFYEDHKWTDEKGYDLVNLFLRDKECPPIETGFKLYEKPSNNINVDELDEFILSRHSVRDFQDRKIEKDDLKLGLRWFNEAPTACNRQMCKIYFIENDGVKKLLDKVIIGLPGFNINHTSYFVITYDLAAFAYSGERDQGMLNVGLCSMNFINGLHAKGIGTCCLQWSNNKKEDRMVRRELKLSESERIGLVIAAGYYLDRNVIPCSVRRREEDIISII